MANPTPPETVHRLPSDPVHLFQRNPAPDAYNNPMGCGAFSTTMGMSAYDPPRYGTYEMAREVFAHMIKVPFFGGTFESQDSAIARRYGFRSYSYDYGTVDDLAAAIDLGAPAVLLMNPNKLGIGTHDVLLVGYSTDAQGAYLHLFMDNPWLEPGTQPAPAGLSYPGNETMAVADLPHHWTGIFSPIWHAPDPENQWRQRTRRG